jgi:hypothetical protein
LAVVREVVVVVRRTANPQTVAQLGPVIKLVN